jgi:pimeloyl-ACP methyl ester carboxylesterase
MTLHRHEWGRGRPVIALAPLGLDAAAFAGFGSALSLRGLRTIAADLPGFGRTPAPDAPLTPSLLAASVVDLARGLDERPVVLGISLGGRVALEAALTAPELFRAVIAVAPYLPWRRYRFLLEWAALIDPRVAGWMSLERLWPLLRWLSRTLEALPWVGDDEVAQAGARLVYHLACPATRASFLSAARELALDPADGPRGLWSRLRGVAVPTAFVWGERDRLVSLRFSRSVARECPQARQLLLPCVGHWINGPHHRCLAAAVALLVEHLLDGTAPAPETATCERHGVRFVAGPCAAGDGPGEPRPMPLFGGTSHGP